jgi:hypothetical protein
MVVIIAIMQLTNFTFVKSKVSLFFVSLLLCRCVSPHSITFPFDVTDLNLSKLFLKYVFDVPYLASFILVLFIGYVNS